MPLFRNFFGEKLAYIGKNPYLCTVSNSTKLHKMREMNKDRREMSLVLFLYAGV